MINFSETSTTALREPLISSLPLGDYTGSAYPATILLYDVLSSDGPLEGLMLVFANRVEIFLVEELPSVG